MYPRTNYEMTQVDLAAILDACKPVPMIMLNIITPRGPQERANGAWAVLGKKMGFDHMTVKLAPGGDRFFTAIPSETEEQQACRLQAKADQDKRDTVTRMEAEIKALQNQLTEILA